MCNNGSALYLALTRSVPQIPSGRNDLLHLMKVKTPESENARLVWETHWQGCKICQNEHITATQYAAIRGWDTTKKE